MPSRSGGAEEEGERMIARSRAVREGPGFLIERRQEGKEETDGMVA